MIKSLSILGFEISLPWASSGRSHVALLGVARTLTGYWRSHNWRNSISSLLAYIFSAVSWRSWLKEKVVLHLLVLIKCLRFLGAVYHHSIPSLEVWISWSPILKRSIVIIACSLGFVLGISIHPWSCAAASLISDQFLNSIVQASLALGLISCLIYLWARLISCVRILAISIFSYANCHILLPCTSWA